MSQSRQDEKSELPNPRPLAFPLNQNLLYFSRIDSINRQDIGFSNRHHAMARFLITGIRRSRRPSIRHACNASTQRQGRSRYVEVITYCESVRDQVSRDTLEDILSDSEEHHDYPETQIELVEKIGRQDHLQTAMGGIDA